MAARYISRSLASIVVDLKPRRLRSRLRTRNFWNESCDAQSAAAESENDNGVANADEVFDARGVPVGQSNTAVTCGPTYGLRIVRSVDTDARFVQAHPENADEVVRTG